MSTHRRVVLFGMPCAFTKPVLAALLEAPGIELRAVVLAGPGDAESIETTGPLAELLRKHRISARHVASRAEVTSDDVRRELAALAPDVAVVACFPWRVPEALLAVPARGWLNVHPSLLPDGPGPEPVFWAFRWNLTETGVTVHALDRGFDTGPILAQCRVPIPGDATLDSLEYTLAKAGAELLVERLPAFLDGSAAFTPQHGAARSYAAIPRVDDLLVDTSWLADHAARFIRAVRPVYGPVPLTVLATGQRFMVDEVAGIDVDTSLPEPVRMNGLDAHIRCLCGVLICRLVAARQPLSLHRPGSVVVKPS